MPRPKTAVLALVLAFGLGAGAGAQALLSEEEIAQAARELHRGPAFQSVAVALALAEPLREPVSEHFRAIYAEPAAVNGFLTAFAAAQGGFDADRAALMGIARAFAAGWAMETAALGAARLPVADQRGHLELSRAALDVMGPEVCAAFTRGALDALEIAAAELAALAMRPPEAAAEHLALMRRALLAEVNDDPPFVPLSSAEARRATETYRAAYLAAIEAHPNRAAIEAAVRNFDIAPDEAICDLTRLSLDAALGLEGDVGDLAVRLLTSG